MKRSSGAYLRRVGRRQANSLKTCMTATGQWKRVDVLEDGGLALPPVLDVSAASLVLPQETRGGLDGRLSTDFPK